MNTFMYVTLQIRKMENGNSDKQLQMLMMLLLLPIIICLSEQSAERSETTQGTSIACTVCECKNSIVNCSSRDLTNITIPKDIPTDTKTLNLSGNQLGTLGNRVFVNLTKLERLILSKSSITHLSNETFEGLTNLQELDISCNEPLSLTNETTPARLFIQLTNLKVLKMYGNVGTYNDHLNYIDAQLSPLTNLVELWIDGFTQNPFGKAYRNLTSLKTLQIAGDHIPKRWRRSEFCQITNVTATFFENLIHVQKFTITNCGLESIDKKAFGNLQSLEYLDLSDNQHLGLPSAIGSLCHLTNSKLTTLYMNRMIYHQPGNCMVHLTEDMAKCLQNIPLQELHIDYNRINYIHSNALKYLPKSLKTITANGNELELGLYIFQTYELSNATSISIAYQGYINDVSIWHKGNTVYKSKAILSNVDSDGEFNAEDEQLERSAYRETIALDDGYHDTFLMAEHYKHILGNSRIGSATQRGESEPTSSVKVNPICPQFNDGKYIPPETITVFLPPLLTDIDLSHSRLGSPIYEMFVNESNSIKTINASSSMLYCWEGPIHGLTKLESLDLSHNFCLNVSSRIFQGLPNLKDLNIGYNFLGNAILGDVEGKILENLFHLRVLVLERNNIFKIPRVFFKSLVSLEKLNLRVNSLETFDVEIGHMTKLREVNLQANRIKTLSPHTRDTFDAIAAIQRRDKKRKGLYVNLRYNSIHCYCNNIDFIKWVFQNYGKKSNNSLTVQLSTCVFLDNRKASNVTTRGDISEVFRKLEDSCRSYTELIVCVSVLLAVIINIIIAVIVHRYRWRLQYWYFVVLKGYSCSLKQQIRHGYIEIDENPGFIYDAYVAYFNDPDEFFIDNLKSEFKKHSVRTFLQSYHITGDSHFADVVGNAIHQSRVMVFILSEGWSDDYEMATAYHMWRHDKEQRDAPFTIGVRHGEMNGDDLRDIDKIQANAFYDYPGDTNEDEVNTFWTTLVQTIQANGNGTDAVDSRHNSHSMSVQ